MFFENRLDAMFAARVCRSSLKKILEQLSHFLYEICRMIKWVTFTWLIGKWMNKLMGLMLIKMKSMTIIIKKIFSSSQGKISSLYLLFKKYKMPNLQVVFCFISKLKTGTSLGKGTNLTYR